MNTSKLLLLLLVSCANDSVMTKVVEKQQNIAEGDNPGECSDAIDNDADGYIDCEDQDCEEETVCIGTPPIIESFVLDPTEPRTNDVIDTQVEVSDAESDPVTLSFKWYVDGQEIADEIGDSLGGSDHFAKGQAVYASVIPSDGEHTGEAVNSNVLVVRNTPPSQPEVSVSPNPAATTNDLTCSIDLPSTDDDGDNIVYNFIWLDGNTNILRQIQGTVDFTDTLPAETTVPGEITCEVTPHDGEEYGPASIYTTTVESFCPNGQWHTHQGEELFFCDERLDLQASAEACTSLGMDLLQIRNQSENDFVRDVSLDIPIHDGNQFEVWIGLNDRDTEGAYLWENGDTPVFSSWNAGQPDGGGAQNCSIMNLDPSDGYGTGYWHDTDCGRLNGFVCERPSEADDDGDGIPAFEDCDDNDANIGQCEILAIFPDSLAYDEASLDCQQRGGHLAWIENETENEQVYQLCETYGVNSGCFIGLQYPYTNWNSGVPVTYSNWYLPHFENNPAIPKVWMYNSRRGILAGIAKWDDIDGNYSESHICRLPANGDSNGSLGTSTLQ